MPSLNEEDILKIIEFKENKLSLNELRKEKLVNDKKWIYDIILW